MLKKGKEKNMCKVYKVSYTITMEVGNECPDIGEPIDDVSEIGAAFTNHVAELLNSVEYLSNEDLTIVEIPDDEQ